VEVKGAESFPTEASCHLPSSRHYLSYNDCLEDNREHYHNCSVLCCVRHLCKMICTHTYEQFLNLSVGLGLVLVFCLFRFSILCVFWFSLDYFIIPQYGSMWGYLVYCVFFLFVWLRISQRKKKTAAVKLCVFLRLLCRMSFFHWQLSSIMCNMSCAELQRNNDLIATEYGMFAANPMGTSFDQSSTGAGAPAVGPWSANQQRLAPAVSTLRRSQQPSITSPRSVVLDPPKL